VEIFNLNLNKIFHNFLLKLQIFKNRKILISNFLLEIYFFSYKIKIIAKYKI